MRNGLASLVPVAYPSFSTAAASNQKQAPTTTTMYYILDITQKKLIVT